MEHMEEREREREREREPRLVCVCGGGGGGFVWRKVKGKEDIKKRTK